MSTHYSLHLIAQKRSLSNWWISLCIGLVQLPELSSSDVKSSSKSPVASFSGDLFMCVPHLTLLLGSQQKENLLPVKERSITIFFAPELSHNACPLGFYYSYRRGSSPSSPRATAGEDVRCWCWFHYLPSHWLLFLVAYVYPSPITCFPVSFFLTLFSIYCRHILYIEYRFSIVTEYRLISGVCENKTKVVERMIKSVLLTFVLNSFL